MAFRINDNCIVCSYCEPVCPVRAISLGEDIYEINEKKCIDCIGFFNEAQCYIVCPVNAIEYSKKDKNESN